MPKGYYCDYCDRSFPDGADNRKKHLASISHQKQRNSHYAMCRDAATILRENASKNPCKRFHSTGQCDYGPGCKYSHLTPEDITALQERAKIEESNKRKVSLPDPDIKSWLEKAIKKIDKTLTDQEPSSSGTKSYVHTTLPEALQNISSLPPSLIPSNPIDGISKKNSEWG